MSWNRDLSLDEALVDPVIGAALRADRVDPRAFETLLRTTARRLDSGRGPAARPTLALAARGRLSSGEDPARGRLSSGEDPARGRLSSGQDPARGRLPSGLDMALCRRAPAAGDLCAW